jgi:hypothetical protein
LIHHFQWMVWDLLILLKIGPLFPAGQSVIGKGEIDKWTLLVKELRMTKKKRKRSLIINKEKTNCHNSYN